MRGGSTQFRFQAACLQAFFEQPGTGAEREGVDEQVQLVGGTISEHRAR
jgi:hypothetical protein